MNRAVECVSQYLAVAINKRSNRSSVAVLKYAITSLIHLMIFISLVMAFCIITGHVKEGIISMIAFWTLKRYSGGIHLRSAAACNVLSALFVITSIYISGKYWYTGLAFNIIALILMLIYAPSGTTAPERMHRRFKWTAVGIVLSNVLIQSPLLSSVFFIQALTTPRILHRVLDEYNL